MTVPFDSAPATPPALVMSHSEFIPSAGITGVGMNLNSADIPRKDTNPEARVKGGALRGEPLSPESITLGRSRRGADWIYMMGLEPITP